MSKAVDYQKIQELAVQCLDQFPNADEKTRKWWERLSNPGPGPRRRQALRQVAEDLAIVYPEQDIDG